MTKLRARIRDFVLYLGISLLVVAAFVEAALHGVEEKLFQRWLLLFFVTLVVFGLWLERNRQKLKDKRFWKRTLLLFTAHIAIWGWFLWQLNGVKFINLWTFLILGPLELAIFRWFVPSANDQFDRID